MPADDRATADEMIHSLWKTSSVDRDFVPLMAFLDGHSAYCQPCGHDYPTLHRLADFIHDGRAFRVCRCAACGERLSVTLLSIKSGSAPGVPYQLTGSELQRWIDDESEEESNEETDWSRYLSDKLSSDQNRV